MKSFKCKIKEINKTMMKKNMMKKNMINMKVKPLVILCLAATQFLSGCGGNTAESDNQNTKVAKAANIHSINVWPQLDIAVKKDIKVEDKVNALLAKMTLEQKIAQMIQPEIRDITVEDMRQYGFGSYLNGGGAFPNNNKHATPSDWYN